MVIACVLTGKGGKTIISSTKRERLDTTLVMSEALTIRWFLKFALDFDLKNILVFSDALTVVDCINDLDFSTALEPIILDCLSFCNSVKDCIYLYLNHAFNMCVHSLVVLGHDVGLAWTFPIDRKFHLLNHHDSFSSFLVDE